MGKHFCHGTDSNPRPPGWHTNYLPAAPPIRWETCCSQRPCLGAHAGRRWPWSSTKVTVPPDGLITSDPHGSNYKHTTSDQNGPICHQKSRPGIWSQMLQGRNPLDDMRKRQKQHSHTRSKTVYERKKPHSFLKNLAIFKAMPQALKCRNQKSPLRRFLYSGLVYPPKVWICQLLGKGAPQMPRFRLLEKKTS